MNSASDTFATEPSARIHLPVSIPDHELLCCIGRGSYGEVWLARNTMMGSFRAVKIVFACTFKDVHPFEREIEGIRKFEPVSRSHEGLVDVLQVGQNQAEKYFYYVMELGDDVETSQNIAPDHYVPKTLAKEISIRGRLPFDECLQLGLILSGALGHLHGRGLIHRDVKPSNIVFVNGAPKLADIGLVTEIERAASYVGTAGFIPPEGPNSPQADIYGLGKVLYEMATGKDRQEFPDLPVEFRSIPDSARLLELNEVLIRACHQDAAKRYQTAQEMHADLTVLETGNSVKRLRLLERRWSTLKSVTKLAAILALAIGVAGYEIIRNRNESARERERQVGSEIANGTRDLEEGNHLAALPHFVQALRLDQWDPRRIETHRLRLGAVLAHSPKLMRLWFHPERINSVEFSPDGGEVLAALFWEKVHVLNVVSGLPGSPAYGPDKGLFGACFSRDGRFVLTASEYDTASIWHRGTRQEVLRLDHPDRVFGAAFSASGNRVVTACKDKTARIWDASSGTCLRELSFHTDGLLHAEFSGDEEFVVTTGKDGRAALWNAETGKRMGPPLEHGGWVYYGSFSPEGDRLVTASFDRRARLWEVPSGRELPTLMLHEDGVMSARFSPDGRCIVTASLDGTVRLWDAPTGLPLKRNAVIRHSAKVVDAAFSPDGHRIVTGCADGTLRVFDFAAGQVRPRLLPGIVSGNGSRIATIANRQLHIGTSVPTDRQLPPITCPQPIAECGLSRDGRFAITIYTSTNRTVPPLKAMHVWDTESGMPVSPLIPCTNTLNQTSISDNGRFLATVTGPVVGITETLSRKSLTALSHTQEVSRIYFTRDSRRLWAVTGTRVHLWNVATGSEVFPPLSLDATVSHVEESPDGRSLLICTTDEYFNEHSAQVWDASTGKTTGQPLRHRDGVVSGSWSSDGRRIVTASEDFTAKVWNAATGKQLLPVLKHEGQVRAAAFSPDDRWIVTVSADKAVRLWDAHSGVPLTPPLEHEERLERVVFLQDGRSFVTRTGSGRAWLWELPRTGHSLETLESLGRFLASTWQLSGEGKNRVQKEWQNLSSAHPEDFKVSDADIVAWHLQQAAEAERKKRWFVAHFHLERLRAIRPQDTAVEERYAKARQELDPESEEILNRP